MTRFHRSVLRTALSCLLAVAILVAGCSPSILCSIETEILPDYTCVRVTRMEGAPNPETPSRRPRIADYFQFPPAEHYDTYAVQPDKVLFAGPFEAFDAIPPDVIRMTPGTDKRAGNLTSFRVMDMVLFVLADFDETFMDIVANQADGEAALTELIRLLVPEVMAVLNAKYGQRFDLSRLESWLNNDLPQKLRRIYIAAWAIHAIKRSGVTSPGEEFEFYMMLKSEAQREGLELADPNTPNLQQENIRRLREYGMRLMQQLIIPRGGESLSGETIRGLEPNELLVALQQAISARHGSINNFIAKIASLVPRSFGAYLTSSVMPLYMLPNVTYRYRLKVPGVVIQTNGVHEFDGSVVWNFADRDAAFTGYSMWARSIFVREPAVFALGLRGFPSSLADVDRVFGLCLNEQGAPREALLKALGDSIMARGIAPLQALANDANAPDNQAARGMLDLFENHKKSQAARPANPAAQ